MQHLLGLANCLRAAYLERKRGDLLVFGASSTHRDSDQLLVVVLHIKAK